MKTKELSFLEHDLASSLNPRERYGFIHGRSPDFQISLQQTPSQRLLIDVDRFYKTPVGESFAFVPDHSGGCRAGFTPASLLE